VRGFKAGIGRNPKTASIDRGTLEPTLFTLKGESFVGFRMLDDVLAALANPTRRAILRRLTKGDARISDLKKKEKAR
jgi:hypothetical protein